MKWPENPPFDIEKHCILAGYVGSISHGTYRPNKHPNSIDDKDVLGIFIPPIEKVLGLEHVEHFEWKVGEWDETFFSLEKYIRLLLKSNPNVISLLWIEPQFYVKRTPLGDRLLQSRDIFMSKKIYNAFTGYAHGQLKRMTHFSSKGYMGEKRKKLVEKFGYDVKNAAHLIRLLNMGIETLSTGRVNVLRPDTEVLFDIKDGKWPLEKVQDEAERLFKIAQEALIRSSLPDEPKRKEAEALLIDLQKEFYGIQIH